MGSPGLNRSHKFHFANSDHRGMSVAKLRDRMKVRLLKKFAERVDGVDLRGRSIGEVMELPSADGALLVAEQWAMPDRRERECPVSPRRRAEDHPTEES